METIEKGISLGSLALLQDPGVGKTLSTIKICECLWGDGIKKTVVFSPVSTLGNWRKEFLQFADIDSSKVHIVEGLSKKRVDIISKNIMDDCVLILNYEAIQNKEIHAALLRFKPHILICDESQRVKNPSSKRAKAICKLSDQVKHKFILTGTPTTKDQMDIFMQYRILDGGKTFGSNFFAFRHKYFEDKNAAWAHSHKHFPVWAMRKSMEEEFHKKVDSLAVKVRKKDALDLPPFLTKEVEVIMSPEQKQVYEDMRDEFIAFIKEEKTGEMKASVANFALHKSLRLQQIVCGFVKTDEGDIIRFKKNPRLDTLKDLLSDIIPYEKVIIWANFVANQDDICTMLDTMKVKYKTLFGRTKDKQTEINDFQNDENVRVMVANQSAGGVGVNLQQASTAIYYSKSFSLEHDIQSVARCYRGGSDIHDKITRIDLVCPDTIDHAITQALKNKENMADKIFDYINKF